MYLKNRMGENHGSVDSSVTGLKMVMVGNVVLYTRNRKRAAKIMKNKREGGPNPIR